MQQCSIRLPQQQNGSIDEADPDAVIYPKIADIQKSLERIKWYLWHGNVRVYDERCRWLEDDVTAVADEHAAFKKLATKVHEFTVYLTANKEFLVNYGDRYHHKETISSAFVESTVNEVISKRFVKKQSMRWTKAGAHRLLHVRTKVLNDDWRQAFTNWYPGLAPAKATMSSSNTLAQAA